LFANTIRERKREKASVKGGQCLRPVWDCGSGDGSKCFSLRNISK